MEVLTRFDPARNEAHKAELIQAMKDTQHKDAIQIWRALRKRNPTCNLDWYDGHIVYKFREEGQASFLFLAAACVLLLGLAVVVAMAFGLPLSEVIRILLTLGM